MAAPAADWLQSSDVLSLFPTHVWKFELRAARYQRLNRRVITALDALRGTQSVPPGEAWQSPQALHTRAELDELVACFESAVGRVLRFLKLGYQDVAITGCWANVSARGRAHAIHHHPNNYLSGVYYVQTAPGADTINFHDPRVQTGIIRPPVTELTAANTDQVVVRVQAGTLLLFPAFLQHSVSANESDAERISVSFNVMFRAFAEQLSIPLWGEP